MEELTNHHLDTAIQLVKQEIGDVKEILHRIEEQTTKTNGRVSVLEVWKGYLTGGIGVLSLFFIAAVALMFRLIEKSL